MNTTPLKILIADDEAPARSRLRDLLADIANVEIVAEAKNGQEAIALANEHLPDIILLDIRMPVVDGIEAAQHLQKLSHPPAIIFTTAYDNYAIQAFDMNAVDYVLKPIRLERLQTAINKVHALKPKQLEALKPLSPHKTHLSINERGRVLLVPIAEVIYLRAELKYITVRTKEREYLLEESLTHLEQTFSHVFVRLHRNCLVASAYIIGYEKRYIEKDSSEKYSSEKDHSDIDDTDNKNEKSWVALLKDIPETITVSRRQQHLIRNS